MLNDVAIYTLLNLKNKILIVMKLRGYYFAINISDSKCGNP